MSDAIQEAIAKAQAAAGNVANAAAASAPSASTAVVPAAGTAVAAPLPPGQKVSMEQLMTGGMNVDLWIKVKEYGLVVGQSDELVSQFDAYIDLTDGVGFAAKYSIKAGNPAQYWSTYDGVMSDKGIPWAEAQAKACALDNKAKAYPAVDVPMILTEGSTRGLRHLDHGLPRMAGLLQEGLRCGSARPER